MEAENKEESIFEQSDYKGGFGSGPLASAPDADEKDTILGEDDQDSDEDADDDLLQDDADNSDNAA